MPLDNPNSGEARDWLCVSLVPSVGPATLCQLLVRFGSPQGLLEAPISEVESRFGPRVASALRTGADPHAVARALEWLEGPRHHLITLGDARYPRYLLELSDPPAVLYARGNPQFLASSFIAIVGSRNATPQGARDAEAFARSFAAAGLCVASGLALGIDAAAHRGGLAAAGSSVAVVGTGADQLYPRDNRALSEALEERGCIISEFPLGTVPDARNFPRRNRLISGLSRGVLVVEAASRSGSLITARYALEQGRDVFAIPGSIHSPQSRGCHKLIRDGAKLVECAEDVLSEWSEAVSPAAAPQLPAQTDPFLAALGHAPISIDRVCELTGLKAAAIAARLTRLQLEGRVTALAGGLYQQKA